MQRIARKYQLQHLIAEGGQSYVYHGWDEVHNRNVAIKILKQPTDSTARSYVIEQFRREAKLRFSPS